jgi:hypothetical protein
MTDDEFLHALETCALAEREFGHTGHVRAAYLYLQKGDFAATLARMQRAIRQYAAFLGKPDRYHETVTVAFLALIQQHVCERGNAGNWEAFARENPGLLEPKVLLRFYPRAQLESELARRIFLLPQPTAP